MESNTFPNSAFSSTTSGIKLTDLPNELLLCIFDECSDLTSLKNLTLSHPHFYRLFAPRSQVMAATVLRCQVPDETFPILRTALHTKHLDIPNMMDLGYEERLQVVSTVPECDENNLPTAVPVAEAIGLERLYRKIDGLTEVFMRDERKWHKVSLRDPRIDAVKTRFHDVQRFEIQQAVCVFEMLRRTLGRKSLPRGQCRHDGPYFAWIMDRMRSHLFRRCNMSDWHSDIACVLDDYFEGNLAQLNTTIYRRTRTLPNPKKQTVDFFYKYMCEEVCRAVKG